MHKPRVGGEVTVIASCVFVQRLGLLLLPVFSEDFI